MLENFAAGMQKGLPDALRAADNAASMIADAMQVTSSATVNSYLGDYANGGDAFGQNGVSVYGGINITIDGRGKDAAELARELQIELQRRIPAWA